MLPRDHRLGASAEPSVFDQLAAAGRRAPDGLLALAAGVGLLVAILPPLLWPAGWWLALAGGATAGFGVWGIADRTATEWRAGEHPGAGRAAAIVAALAAAAGSLAAVLFVLGLVAIALMGVIH